MYKNFRTIFGSIFISSFLPKVIIVLVMKILPKESLLIVGVPSPLYYPNFILITVLELQIYLIKMAVSFDIIVQRPLLTL